MPYCRRCGTKLDENARFCTRCGMPVGAYPYAPVPPPPPIHHRHVNRKWIIIPIVLLIAILATALIVTALVFTPVHPFSLGHTDSVNQPNIKILNLNFQADVAQVNIMAQNATGYDIVIYTSASGSTGVGNSNVPVQISFSNQTVGNTLTVNSKVSTSGVFGAAAKVTCDVYLNPDLFLNVNVTTDTGQINLNQTQQATFQSLTLKSTTGEITTDLQNGATIAGEMSIKSTTGAVMFNLNQTKVVGNRMFNVQTTTGKVDMQFMENSAFGENLQVNASSNTGEIDLSVNLNNDAGAKIQPQTDTGQINTNLNNFSHTNSLIESYNYPAQTNFLISLQTNVGSININAAYESSAGPIISN